MKEIHDIAGKHLGKAGDGSSVKPYITPDIHDKSLLVPVPRSLNRLQYDIHDEKLPFVGCDLWNAYEVSFLLNNGYPLSGVLQLKYSAFSTNIVESKSLKLYLNSFNMEKLGKTSNQAIKNFLSIVLNDLVEAVDITEKDVSVAFFSPAADGKFYSHNENDNLGTFGEFSRIESTRDITKLDFTSYKEDPSLLKAADPEVVRLGGMLPQFITTNALRSNCRVTNQPDWGDVYLYVKGNKVIEPGSFLQYIVSMRKENHFHEEICEMIYKRVHDLLKPKEMLVACLYTRRGGIDINPIRASSNKVVKQITDDYLLMYGPQKTLRQ